MKTNLLRTLSITELENLLELQKRILDFTLLFEQELLEEGSRRQLETTRNEALDKMNQLTKEIKKREK